VDPKNCCAWHLFSLDEYWICLGTGPYDGDEVVSKMMAYLNHLTQLAVAEYFIGFFPLLHTQKMEIISNRN
jgi:hypothetical protein